jgi:hypothetical protein
MRRKNPVVNPYLFQLIKALVRLSMNGGNDYITPISQPKWDDFCMKNPSYSVDTMLKLMRDTKNSLVTLDTFTLNSLCSIIKNTDYTYSSWAHFVECEGGCPAATFSNKRLYDLNIAQQDAIKRAVGQRVLQLNHLLLTGANLPDDEFEEPSVAEFEAKEAEKMRRIEFTKAFSRKFSQPEVLERRVRAWYVIINAVAEQQRQSPDTPPNLYLVQQQVELQEWLNIRYVIGILASLYTEHMEGNIEPAALYYDIKEFVSIWHQKILLPYTAHASISHWQVVRGMDRLSEFYADIENVIY